MVNSTATVTAYINTGFSGINIPDSPDILERGTKVQLEVINCLPLNGEVNPTIRVKEFQYLSETDYVKIQWDRWTADFWAKVTGYKFLNADTVELYLAMDYFLTLGGVNGIRTLSGVTKRVHVPKADDELFAFIEPDEMINPAKPLKAKSFDVDMSYLSGTYADDDVIVVLSTLDLYAIGKAYDTSVNPIPEPPDPNDPDPPEESGFLPTAKTACDGTNYVVLPSLYTIGDIVYNDYPDIFTAGDVTVGDDPDLRYGGIQIYVPNPENGIESTELVTLSLPYVGYFDGKDETVQKGISALHDCGVEDAILEQYRIPAEYLGYTATGSVAGRLFLISRNINGLFDTGLKYEYGGYECRNKKAYAGECNAYTIYAKANSDMETFNPETLSVGMNGDEPVFRMFADLRKSGGAMCMPASLDGDYKRWYMNFVKEMEFQSVPLKFDGASGRLINDKFLSLSMNTKNANFNQKYPLSGNTYGEAYDVLGTLVGGEGGLISGTTNMFMGNYGSGAAQILGGFLDEGMANQKLSDYSDLASKRQAYLDAQLAEEKTSMQLNNTYVAPQIKFQQSQTLRELVGNGFVIIKYQLQDSDLQRVDKLLTMYGYRHSKALELSDLLNRPAFNYIEASDVHIEVNRDYIPKWVIEGAEAQLHGARIWHQHFDANEYEDNE